MRLKPKPKKTLLDKIKGDQTVIFVSHSDQQIQKICDRCIWLNQGVIVAQGDTKEVIAQYSQ
jgi:lipopolysaccharide transport system ATP-binding protein